MNRYVSMALLMAFVVTVAHGATGVKTFTNRSNETVTVKVWTWGLGGVMGTSSLTPIVIEKNQDKTISYEDEHAMVSAIKFEYKNGKEIVLYHGDGINAHQGFYIYSDGVRFQ